MNENELQVFANDDFGNVRTIVIEGKPYFVGKDIATALGYSNASKAVSTHCKNIVKKVVDVSYKNRKIHTKSRNTQLTSLIQWNDVLLLIQKAKTLPPNQKVKFKNWLSEETGMENNLFFIEYREEIEFFDKLEEMFSIMNIQKGIKQYNVLGKYRIDYYIPELKIAIEYDENGHSGYTYEQHEGRQEEIQKELCCEFVRLDNRDDIFTNIAKVFKVNLHKSINKWAYFYM